MIQIGKTYLPKGLLTSAVVVLIFMAAIGRGALPTQAQAAGLPITAANVGQVRPLKSTHVPYDDYSKRVFNADGSQVAFGFCLPTNVTDVFNTQTGEQVATLAGYVPLAFRPDGKALIVSTCDEKATAVWDIAQQTQTATFPGQLDGVSLDGRLLVVDHGGLAQLLSLDHPDQPLATFVGIADIYKIGFPRARFSADSTSVVWIDQQAKVHLWNIAAQAEQTLPTYTTANNYVTPSFTFSPDGSLFALVLDDHHVWVSNMITHHATTIAVPNLFVSLVQFSPDDHTLIAQDQVTQFLAAGQKQVPTAIGFFDIASGNSVGSLLRNEDSNDASIAFSPDGKTALLAFYSGLRGWNLATNTAIALPNALAQDSSALMQFSPDGSLLYMGADDHTGIWDTKTWQKVGVLPGIGYELMADNSRLMSFVGDWIVWFGVPDSTHPTPALTLPGSAANTLYVHALPSASGRTVGRIDSGAEGWATAQNNGYLYLADYGGWVREGVSYFSLDNAMPMDYLPKLDPAQITPLPPTPNVTASPEIHSSPTPSATPTITDTPTAEAATASTTESAAASPATLPPTLPGDVRIEPENADQVTLLGVIPATAREGYAQACFCQHLRLGGSDQLSANGQTFVQNGPVLHLWDTRTLTELPAPPDGQQSHPMFAISDDGETLAYTLSTDPQTVHVWSIAAGREVAHVSDTLAPLNFLWFSPDGTSLVVSTSQPTPSLRVWNLTTDHLVIDQQGASNGFAFSPDSRQIAISGPNGPVWLYATADGTPGPTINTTDMWFGYPFDGQLFTFTGGDNPGLFLWDTHTGQMKSTLTLNKPTGYLVNAFNASDDNHTMIARLNLDPYGTPSSPILVWDVATGKLRASLPGSDAVFGTDQTLWVANAQTLSQYDLDGHQLSKIATHSRGHLDITPDGRELALGDSLFDLTTGKQSVIRGGFATLSSGGSSADKLYAAQFSADGTRWLISAGDALLVFGIPTAAHPAWTPISAKIKVNGLSVHMTPASNSRAIGAALGTVTVSGRNADGSWLYSPDAKGWLNRDYVDLNGHFEIELPILVDTPSADEAK